MRLFTAMHARWSAFLDRGAAESRAMQEIELHLAMEIEQHLRAGCSTDEARRRAYARFGGVAGIQEELRDGREFPMIEPFARDVWLAARSLRRSPGFSITAILALGLAIGGNAAVFSVVDQTLLRPLPVSDPDRLMMLWEENPERGWSQETAAPANVLDWKDRVDSFADVAAFASFAEETTLSTGGATADVVTVRWATGNLFDVLGVDAVEGRLFRWEETWDTSEPVAVLSQAAWQGRFGGDPSVIGGFVRLDGLEYRLIGVLPEAFELPAAGAEVWTTFRWSPSEVTAPSFRRAHWVRPIARLAEGATVDQARAELAGIAAQLQAEYPETNRAMGAGLTPLHDFLVADRKATLIALLGAVGLLLLLAIANVGNLFLLRALGRSGETALRNALGASRRRIVGLAVIDSALITLGATAFGMGVAAVLLDFLGPAAAVGIAARPIRLDGSFAMYLVVLVLVVTALLAAIPAMLSLARSHAAGLRSGGRTAGLGRTGRRAVAALATTEVALALLLLVGSLLLVRSYSHLQRVDPGFVSERVLTASVVFPEARYAEADDLAAAYSRLIDAIEPLPGVETAALVRQLPLTERGWSSDLSVFGRPPDEFGVELVHREITARYFETLRVPLIAGRFFTPSDDSPDAERVAIVNQALVVEHFTDENPIGQRVAFTRSPDDSSEWWTIVGVVGNERQAERSAPPRPEIFVPLSQDPTAGIALVARTSFSDPGALASALRSAIHALDPELGVHDLRTLEAVEKEATAREALLAWLLSGFAGIALVLAVLGVYSVMAQAARERRRELGIRMALGAVRGRIIRILSRDSLVILGAGLALGLLAAAVASRIWAALLFGVSPLDPASVAAASGILGAAGLAAGVLPALLALRTELTAVLREE